MSEHVTRRLVIRGRVQGVWFRESMRRQAEAMNVTGWVRNRADGAVEAVVQGSPQAVAAITRWARRGPDAAHVEALEESAAEGRFEGFEKRASG